MVLFDKNVRKAKKAKEHLISSLISISTAIKVNYLLNHFCQIDPIFLISWLLYRRSYCDALCKQELLGPDRNTCLEEENVEAICQLFHAIGKQLDDNPKSRRFNDVHFNRLKELALNPQLAPRLRFMVCDVLDLRANNLVPR